MIDMQKVFEDWGVITSPLTDAEVREIIDTLVGRMSGGDPTSAIPHYTIFGQRLSEEMFKHERSHAARVEAGRKGGLAKLSNAKQCLIKENEKAEKEKYQKKENKELRENTPLLSPPITPLDEAIEKFVKHRKVLKKPMSDYAIELLRKRLNRMRSTDEERIELINYAILKGWQGVYEPDERDKRKAPSLQYAQHTQTDSDLNRLLVNLDD